MNSRREGLARSVQTRLARHAKTINTDPNLVLTRYAVERFLYRLSRSPHVDRFVLKGALLMLAWFGDTLRPTRDADLLGFNNSRMKDYFDLHALSREGVGYAPQLDAAIAATFERRKTPLPNAWPLGLSDAFAYDAGKVAQWQAFLSKNRLDAPSLDAVIVEIQRFLAVPLASARKKPSS